MKKIILLLFIPIILIAQDEENLVLETEVALQVSNSSDWVRFWIEPEFFLENDLHSKTYAIDINTHQFKIKPDNVKSIDVFGNLLCINNGLEYRFFNEDDLYSTNSCGTIFGFRNGLYKINIEVDQTPVTFLLFDNRHNRFPANSYYGGNNTNDVTIRYSVGENKILALDELRDETIPDALFNEYQKGEVINWWEITGMGEYTIDDVSGFENRDFPFLNAPERVSSFPFLTWSPPTIQLDIARYDIHRAILPDNFVYIASTNQTEFLDTEIHWSTSPSNNQKIQYRVVAVYDDENYPHNKGYSNTRKINVGKWFIAKRGNLNENDTFEEVILKNYPNPFNSSTKIMFYLTDDSYITVKVYDNLGKEIKTLINGLHKDKGLHEIYFDSSSLSSGIYYYTLNSGSVFVTNKMIILK